MGGGLDAGAEGGFSHTASDMTLRSRRARD